MKGVGIIAIAIVTLGSQAYAATELTPHMAEYKVKISVVSGRLNTELRKTADGYIANHVIKPTGLSKLLASGTMDVTSEFSSQPDGVKPIRFRSIDTIGDDPDVDLFFDWATNEVAGAVGENHVTLQLDGISFDNVSIQYELMHDLLNGGPGEEYTLFDVDKMRHVKVSKVGTRDVKTRAGTYKAVGIQHQKNGSSRITTLWCAEELGFLPVIIEQHRKGKLNFRATLVSYSATEG